MAERKYKPRHAPLANAKGNQITSQNNCAECHGDNIPDLPGKNA
jgi:mono/diheme cytochrome c family protein